jgi:acyl-CoA synthetase (AMP-forming)/AMP-acid ligase II
VPEPSQQADRGTLARLITGHASAAADRIALLHGDRSWSYVKLAAAAGALASAMGADHLAGERVALCCPTEPRPYAAISRVSQRARWLPPSIPGTHLRRSRPRYAAPARAGSWHTLTD